MIRLVKIILVVFVGLQGLFYFISNVFNFEYALMAVGEILSQRDSQVYQNLIVPPITSPLITKAALISIMIGELLVGLFSFKGALDLYAVRKSSAEIFNSAKKYAILGCATALIVWFGFFTVIGAALLQMWQGQVGAGSFQGAFIYMGTSAFIMIFVNQPDD